MRPADTSRGSLYPCARYRHVYIHINLQYISIQERYITYNTCTVYTGMDCNNLCRVPSKVHVSLPCMLTLTLTHTLSFTLTHTLIHTHTHTHTHTHSHSFTLTPTHTHRELAKKVRQWTWPRPPGRLRSCILLGRRSWGLTSPSSTTSWPPAPSLSSGPLLMSTPR